MNRNRKLSFILSVLFFWGCGSTSEVVDPNDPELKFSKEIAAFQDVDNDGNEITTHIIEQIKGESRILRVKITTNGKTVESIHNLSGQSFYIEIPVLNRFRKDTQRNEPITTEEFKINQEVFEQNLNRAKESMLESDYTNAMLAVDKALEIDKNNVQALMMKGSIFYALGKPSQAVREYEKALEIEPDNAEIIDFLNYIKEKDKGNQQVADPFQ